MGGPIGKATAGAGLRSRNIPIESETSSGRTLAAPPPPTLPPANVINGNELQLVYAVGPLVKALGFKQEGRKFDSRRCHFSLT
jgi:hypothetical protein